MSARLRAAAALGLGLLWFGVGGPEAARWLLGQRRDLSRQAPEAEAQEGPEALAYSEAQTRRVRAERDWEVGVTAVLSADERALALGLPPPPPAVMPHGISAVDGEIWALAQAILHRHGALSGPLPEIPRADRWQGVDRRGRAQALRALVTGPGITDDQAASLLALTLRVLDAQVRAEEAREALLSAGR